MDTDTLEYKSEGYMIKLWALFLYSDTVFAIRLGLDCKYFWASSIWTDSINKREIDGKIDGFEGTKTRTSSTLQVGQRCPEGD